MKIFLCVALSLAVVSAAPADQKEAPRDKRGIFGEPGGLLTPHLHHDPLLGSHLHAPLAAPSLLHAPLAAAPILRAPTVIRAPAVLHAPSVLHAPLHAPLISSSSLHHHDLHDHALLHDLHHHDLHAPIIATSHAHSPLIHDLHHDLHHDFLPHAPLIHSHHVAPTVIRVRAPARHIIRSGW